MPLLAMLAGAVLGGMLGRGFDAIVAGGFIGLIAGLVVNSWRKSRAALRSGAAAITAAEADDPLALLDPRVAERLRAMERRIATLEASLRGAPVSPVTTAAPVDEVLPTDFKESPSAEASVADSVETAHAEASAADAVPPMPAYGVARAAAAPATTTATAHGVPPAMPPEVSAPVPPGVPPAVPTREPGAVWRAITGGNTLARVGVVVLFIGVAFLVKYASEQVTIPIGVRLAGVALGGIVLLALGFRLRNTRAGYAMSLQGAGVGVLYLTVFAALRLYQMLPPLAAFTLLFWIAALSSYLAVRQDSMALAILGIVGGFAAPVLTSSGGGSHVMLFSYYAVLNAAIFAIAWFKAWRLLNVIGFVCTFLVGTLWGVTRYRPESFATTEPFLVLFFLFYVGIATFYAMRRSLEVRRYVDATLVFGTPLVAAGLQGALVRRIEYGMAWSALGASVIYLGLARLLYTRHRDDLRLLTESFLALGVVFATLAVPLALDARLTSATWALEGAALVWVGVRQQHLGARVFGLLLQVAAGLAFGLGFSLWTHRLAGGNWPVLNADCIGALLVATGGFVSARILGVPPSALRADATPMMATATGAAGRPVGLAGATAVTETERTAVPVMFAWAVSWWLGAGWREIERFVPVDARISALVAFLAVSAVAFAGAARRLDWSLARVPALLFAPALLLIALWRVGDLTPRGGHLFGAYGAVAWPFAIAVLVLLVRHVDRLQPPLADAIPSAGRAIAGWLLTLVVAGELAWVARQYAGGEAWRLVPWGIAPALAVFTIVRWTVRADAAPGARMRADSAPDVRVRAWLIVCAIPLVVAALAWTLYANVTSAGDPAPLPFIPLANPLDIAQGLVFAAIALWLSRVRDVEHARLGAISAQAIGASAAGLLLFWVTFATLRTLHHWADVPWHVGAMWTSRIVQTALSIVWSVFALAAMVVAHRRHYRAAWVAGAALLAVVVVKLFFVDLSQVGGVERIVSFMGVGVLLLVIGYVAPVPPRQEAA